MPRTKECVESLLLQWDFHRQKAKACGTVNYVCRACERGEGELRLFTREVQSTY